MVPNVCKISLLLKEQSINDYMYVLKFTSVPINLCCTAGDPNSHPIEFDVAAMVRFLSWRSILTRL